jgi:hypothetical protein
MIWITSLLLLLSNPLISSDWQELTLLDLLPYGIIKATSELEGNDKEPGQGKYGVIRAFDKDYSTAWVEGKDGSGIHQSIYIVVAEDRKTINLFNGYGKTPELYQKNNRVKKLKLSCLVAISPEGYVSETSISYQTLAYEEDYFLNLKDTFALQSFPFPFSSEQQNTFRDSCIKKFNNEFNYDIGRTDFILKMEIIEIYPGSQWDDTCISEVFFNNLYLHNPYDERYRNITDIYLNKEENTILLDSDKSNGLVLFEDTSSVFQIIDFSEDKRWVICIRMPADPGEGRVETEYLLFNAQTGKLMNERLARISGENIFGPFFFTFRQNQLFLEYALPDGSGFIELH